MRRIEEVIINYEEVSERINEEDFMVAAYMTGGYKYFMVRLK